MKGDFPAIFTPSSEGGYVVQFYDEQGCITEGDTLEEAITNAEDALNTIMLYLEDEKQDIPTPTPIEDIKVKDGEVIKVIHADTKAYAKKMAKIEANPIKAAREARGWNLKQLADFLHAPYRTMQDWNSGHHFPPRWIQDIIVEKIYSA